MPPDRRDGQMPSQRRDARPTNIATGLWADLQLTSGQVTVISVELACGRCFACPNIYINELVVIPFEIHTVRVVLAWAAGEAHEMVQNKTNLPAADVDYVPIGDLAREFNVTLRALRFYESKGLIKPKRRGNLRLYTADDRRLLARILKAKQLGFTLGEIRALLADDGKSSGAFGLNLSREQCVEQIELLERQKQEIEDALAELRQICPDL
jgi:DNA-binding transcriptional MerR regulator